MATRNPDAAVHRLLDMVVEEVSLVDRAANQHRFLVVKRSDSMEESQTNPAPSAPAEPASAPALPPVSDDEVTLDLNETPPELDELDEGVQTAPPVSAIEIATTALQNITDAVDALGHASDDEARERVTALAKELQTAAAQLGGGTPAATAAPVDKGDFDAVLASVRATLERVGRTLSAVQPKTAAEPAAKPAASTSPNLAAKLDEVLAAVRALGETVKAQQQRLAQVEKRFGLPNSAPTGERAGRAVEDADIGWPLDLNRPYDRESVDKAVSFHDL
ncbi:hypothetical protein [Haliangium ochraceum]|uniref:Uncharacterized protein n=1 Tax=Haliangium ochraceum (strain DSM 14365 / JCM 11303 / SMP-2) TaxID=502025 RepID=D0LLR3_HALO1|nr:hypothetical protein [Haliangium ochraceum]ACY13280.1 conserved hypothetical protein [Haliangium ochraceum DSM 14365]